MSNHNPKMLVHQKIASKEELNMNPIQFAKQQQKFQYKSRSRDSRNQAADVREESKDLKGTINDQREDQI